jgi:myo-inositol-1(or 4)-monophosphatase
MTTDSIAQFAREMAIGAGEILLSGFGTGVAVEYKKGDIDLVTEYDRKSEKYILDQIRARYPEHRILSEESGLNRTGEEPCWVIDPLDGTTNFAHGMPIFSVSIALVEAGVPVAGVVYDPTRRECFWVARGQGAYLDERPIRASRQTELLRTLLVTGFPYDAHSNTLNNIAEFARFSKQVRGVRRLGSAAIDLSYVAAGRLDGYWELRLAPWDLAAGALIAEEAGAKVTLVDGAPLNVLDGTSILAANEGLHARMLAQLQADD